MADFIRLASTVKLVTVALRPSMLELIDNSKPAEAHPEYWARAN